MSTFSLLKGDNRLIIKMGEQQLSLSAQDALVLAESLQASAKEIMLQEKQQKLQHYVNALMVWLESGSFLMGSEPAVEVHRDEVPQHTVVLPAGFGLSKVPVTQSFFKMVMDYNPSRRKGSDLPVESVSWFEAVQFCNRLSTLVGRAPCYDILGTAVHWNREHDGFRLPTEAEWEYAATWSKDGTSFVYSGTNQLADVGWFHDNSTALQTVGQKEPNELGIYDLSGNVFEWCFDRWGPYQEGRQTDPVGATSGEKRSCRGGAWNLSAWCARARFRYAEEPSARCANIGFRIVCGPTDG